MIKNKAKQIDKDFARVCKKHKLEKVAIAIEVPAGNGKYTVMSSCHIRKKTASKQEVRFATAVAHLFQAIGFQNKNVEIATSIVRSRRANQPAPSKQEMALSESARKKLFSIRRKKMKLVKEKKYQEAAMLRSEERKILGLQDWDEDPKSVHETGKAFDLESITENVADMANIGKILFDRIKKDHKNRKRGASNLSE